MKHGPGLDKLRLHTRISLLLTALAGMLVLALGALWLKQTRDSIREEVTAATRVAEQWLVAGAPAPQALLASLQAVGRIRANALEVLARDGRRLYLSPPSPYKAGRAAPAWFGAAVEPRFAARRIGAGELTLILRPDPSRATLDAWDELRAMAGWAAALLAALFLATRRALDRILAPLARLTAALERTGPGCFDTRLPVPGEPELGALAATFNRMAQRLDEAVEHSLRLEDEQELGRRLAAGMARERRAIARELHDELAQGITAVRALAGAIAQRSEDQPQLRSYADSIVNVTGTLQSGVHGILQRLRARPASDGDGDADAILRRYLELWQQHYPAIRLSATLAAGSAPAAPATVQALLRIAQEGLTNVARHAGASQVELTLARTAAAGGDWLEFCLSDDGCGLPAQAPAGAGGFGLAGMRERVAALDGELLLESRQGLGTRLRVRLPANPPFQNKEQP